LTEICLEELTFAFYFNNYGCFFDAEMVKTVPQKTAPPVRKETF
jgi:hypothetical protein